jgi:hypothetical protein
LREKQKSSIDKIKRSIVIQGIEKYNKKSIELRSPKRSRESIKLKSIIRIQKVKKNKRIKE